MYRYVGANAEVVINMKPGLYRFWSESTTGKTFLCKLLKEFRTFGEKVDGYTYDDHAAGISLPDYLGTTDLAAVVIDRYDMYNGEYAEYIVELAKHAVVMITCNSMLLEIDSVFRICSIDLKAGENTRYLLEVFG